MSIKFIGNKTKLLDFLIRKIMSETGLVNGTFVDLFTGTTTVAVAFKKLGFNVIANDKLESSYLYAKSGLLVNKEPTFSKLIEREEIIQKDLFDLPYNQIISELNLLQGAEGLFYNEYSPNSQHKRQYFTESNAKKIDAIRNKIKLWEEKNLISDLERSLLLSSLLLAVNSVANVSGTYGAYLKKWYERSLQPITLNRYPLHFSDRNFEVYKEDANTLVKKLPHTDIVYIDPPYTKRQYQAYYHIPETIAIGDNPKLWGKTGQRPRREDDVSNYCYKSKAGKELLDLIVNIDSKFIFLSYSSDGHITHEEIMDILSIRGTPMFWSEEYVRFKSNNVNNKRTVNEMLYCVKVERS
ncbi:DNA adenine methylase [Bhargavaea massiliensis]|uniref:DNA adenine methylase n=1 Tax=Bhargavaea massiliensis TaxID=2697500 RepID=UPI001BCAD87E|nr:DNA adenine methylase [Bhargavaea massiliensis]